VSSPWYRWNCCLRSRPTTRSSPDAAATGTTRPARGGCGSRLPRRGHHALPKGVRCFASPGSLSRDREEFQRLSTRWMAMASPPHHGWTINVTAGRPGPAGARLDIDLRLSGSKAGPLAHDLR
jgi:hypothetical protein